MISRHRRWIWGTAVIAGATIVLVGSNIGIHFREMQVLLQRNAYLEEGMGQAHLAAKFITQMRLYRQQISNAQADRQEHSLSHMLRERTRFEQGMQLSRNPIDKFNLFLIDILRKSMAMQALPQGDDLRLFQDLETAFHLERSKEYQMALMLYGNIEEQHPHMEPRQRSLILLHKGFCMVILGDLTLARTMFVRVVSDQSGNELGTTASLLLSFLEIIEQEKAPLQTVTLSTARKLTTLLQCKDAMAMLQQLRPQSMDEQAEVAYLNGRCLEEQGRKAQAAQSYSKAIARSSRSMLAKDANRRLFLVATQTGRSQRLQTAATLMNSTLADSTLTEMISIEKLVARSVDTSIPSIAPETLDAIERQVDTFLSRTVAAQDAPESRTMRGSRVRVHTRDGKTFTGVLLSEQGAKVLRLKTMIGPIGIDQREIRKLDRL